MCSHRCEPSDVKQPPRPRLHVSATLYIVAASAAAVITAVLGVPPLVPNNTWLATCLEAASRLIVSCMLIMEVVACSAFCSAALKPIFDDFDATRGRPANGLSLSAR